MYHNKLTAGDFDCLICKDLHRRNSISEKTSLQEDRLLDGRRKKMKINSRSNSWEKLDKKILRLTKKFLWNCSFAKIT